MSGEQGADDADEPAGTDASPDDLGLDEAVEDHDLDTGEVDPVDAGKGRSTLEDAPLDRTEEDLVNPPPEYTIEGLSGQRDPTEEEIAGYRRQFGYLRAYFRSSPEEYATFQRTLNQARMGVSYDEYLSQGAVYSLVTGLVGALFGLVLTYTLAQTGAFGTLRNPTGVGGPLAVFVGNNRVLVSGVAITVIGGILFGGGAWLAFRYYPTSVVVTRRQKLDVTLPHAIVYMYALSYGGMSLPKVLASLADAEDTYGEMANEADAIVRDMHVFGNDLVTALQNSRNITPSNNVEQFLDDLLSVLESGGEVTPFLENESKDYLEEAMDAQEDFLETLSIMSEVFIVGFVAAPLFLVVILVVISLVGGQTLGQIGVLVYAVIPIGMAAFLVLIDTLSEPFVQRGRVTPPSRSAEGEPSLPEGDERYEAYRDQRRRDELLALARNPLDPVRREPLYVLGLSVPAALFVVAAAVASGAAGLSVDAFIDHAIVNTTLLVVIPLLVATVPLSYYHERQRRRENTLSRRLPETLNILSSANKMGIRLTEGLGLVVRSTSGLVATELRKVRNDILWNASTSEALLAFGSRLQVPQLARTTRLLAEGLESTGDLSRVLSIAADDARARYKLERARTREMTSYIAIVVIGYLVYLLVVVLLEANYLTPIAAAAEQQANATGGIDSPLSFTDVPVDTFRAIFFHSAVIQGFGSGLLAGKLSDNTILTGLKYGIGLVLLATVVFVAL